MATLYLSANATVTSTVTSATWWTTSGGSTPGTPTPGDRLEVNGKTLTVNGAALAQVGAQYTVSDTGNDNSQVLVVGNSSLNILAVSTATNNVFGFILLATAGVTMTMPTTSAVTGSGGSRVVRINAGTGILQPAWNISAGSGLFMFHGKAFVGGSMTVTGSGLGIWNFSPDDCMLVTDSTLAAQHATLINNGVWLHVGAVSPAAATPGENFTIAAPADVRAGTTIVSAFATVGVLNLPATSDVRKTVTYDNATKTGLAYIPSAANTRLGVNVDQTTGLAAIPAAAHVRLATATDQTVGTLAVPAAGSVALGVAVDATTGTAVLTQANVQTALAAVAQTVNVVGGIVESNVKQVAGQTANAAAAVTFPAAIGTSTLTAANVWDYLVSAATTVGSIGKRFVDFVTSLVYAAPDNTSIAAIKAKTDNLPADPVSSAVMSGAFNTVNGTLTTIASYIDTEVSAIKAKTDTLPASPASETTTATAATQASQANTKAGLIQADYQQRSQPVTLPTTAPTGYGANITIVNSTEEVTES